MKEILKLFCAEERDIRAYLNELSTEGEYTYACNGAVAVRVARIAGIGKVAGYPNMEKLFAGCPITGEFQPVPVVELLPKQVCPDCKGVKKKERCLECGGAGEITLDSKYNEYEVTCKTCDGYGKIIDECKICDDTGILEPKYPENLFIINGVGFDQKYIHLLGKLPNCQIAPKEGSAPFRFDGGDGIIMSMRMS